MAVMCKWAGEDKASRSPAYSWGALTHAFTTGLSDISRLGCTARYTSGFESRPADFSIFLHVLLTLFWAREDAPRIWLVRHLEGLPRIPFPLSLP